MPRNVFYRIPASAPSVAISRWSRNPQIWDLTLSGVTLCTACEILSGGTTSARITGGSINTTFTIERRTDDDACYWEYVEAVPSTVTGAAYTNTTCSAGTSAFTDLIVSLNYNVGVGWTVGVTFGALRNVTLFTGTIASPADSRTVANSLAACSGPSLHLGHGGNATWVER